MTWKNTLILELSEKRMVRCTVIHSRWFGGLYGSPGRRCSEAGEDEGGETPLESPRDIPGFPHFPASGHSYGRGGTYMPVTSARVFGRPGTEVLFGMLSNLCEAGQCIYRNYQMFH